MRRGYSIIALDHPKNGDNVGGCVRAAQIYGAAEVVVSGARYRWQPTDTMKGYRHLPVVCVEDIFTILPYDCVPVAVEIIEGAKSLFAYQHPERAFYVFGAEDATLGKRITDRCRDIVYVPTDGPMNLAACVNVLLYDRAIKNILRGGHDGHQATHS